MFKNKRGRLFALTLLSSLVAAAIVIAYAESGRTAARDNGFKQQVRNAISELAFTSGGEQSSANLASFISYRSGVLLSDWNLQKLSDAEGLAAENGKSVSSDQLADAITEIAIGKLRNLTDEQRDSAIDALRGFDHPDLPQSFRNGRSHISIRSSGKGRMTAQAASAQIDSLRGDNAEDKIVYALVRNAVALEIESVCSVLAEADPGFFANSKRQMTPLQALLVAYAVATDDPLAGNRSDISQKMNAIQEGASEASGSPYPSFVGHRPYGRNGYIYSTPADLLLDDEALTALVNKLSQTVR